MDNEEREELRRFLAEQVMGWRILEWHEDSWTGPDGLATGYSPYERDYGDPDEHWQPDLRIEQAMKVADKLINQDWEFSLWHNGNHHAAPWDSRFVSHKDERKRGMSISETAAEAISLAVKEAWEERENAQGL